MVSICLYFHIHQPRRLNKFSIFAEPSGDLGSRYFNGPMNNYYFEKALDKCYAPTNKILLGLIDEHAPKFKISFSVSGVLLEEALKFPRGRELIGTLQQLSSTGKVEFLSETYYHSLSSLFLDTDEFREQISEHRGIIGDLFDQTPKVFRNTELIYNNKIGELIESMGFKGVLTEGADHILGWRSPNYVYRRAWGKIKLLLRNYRLSDDIGYRFTARWWSEYPLTSRKYSAWLSQLEGNTANIFMDYETFGEHHWEDSGIMNFLKHLPGHALEYDQLSFKTCSETLDSYDSVGEINIPYTLSWADMERDASAWLGNPIQNACFSELQGIQKIVKEIGDPEIEKIYRLLQTSDHLYYLCTKNWADGDVHKHFSPYKENSPYDNFINYMNILQDFKIYLEKRMEEKIRAGSPLSNDISQNMGNGEKMQFSSVEQAVEGPMDVAAKRRRSK